MQEIIIQFMNQFGYWGILLLIAVENIFPPIPSEVILTFGGFMTTYTSMNVILVILFATIGSVLGAIVLYALGKLLNKERLERIIEGRLGKLLRLKKKDIEKADHWFDTKGAKTVFFCRFVPLVRSLISIPAGMSEMPFLKFVLYTSVGTAIWNSVLVILGRVMGSNWTQIVAFMNYYAKAALFLLGVLLVIGVIIYDHKKKAGDNHEV